MVRRSIQNPLIQFYTKIIEIKCYSFEFLRYSLTFSKTLSYTFPYDFWRTNIGVPIHESESGKCL